MDNIVDAMMGLDKRKEIFNLWYEVTYLRLVVSQIIPNQEVAELNLDMIRKDAQEIVKKRFPGVEISFIDPKTKDDENEAPTN